MREIKGNDNQAGEISVSWDKKFNVPWIKGGIGGGVLRSVVIHINTTKAAIMISTLAGNAINSIAENEAQFKRGFLSALKKDIAERYENFF